MDFNSIREMPLAAQIAVVVWCLVLFGIAGYVARDAKYKGNKRGAVMVGIIAAVIGSVGIGIIVAVATR